MNPLHVYESGPPTAPAVVFLHGDGLSGRAWQPQMERLVDFHCLAPDLPEHGQSAANKPLSMAATVEEVARLIAEKAAGGRANLVGLSFGGVVAQALAVRYPERLERLLLSGTSTRLSRFLVAVQALNVPVLRLLSPGQIGSLMAKQFNIPTEYRQMLQPDLARFTAEAFGRVNQTYLDIETPSNFQGPSLVVVGQKETFIAKDMARKIARTMPNARAYQVQGVGHAWNLEAPDLFSDTVQAWMNDQPLPNRLQPL